MGNKVNNYLKLGKEGERERERNTEREKEDRERRIKIIWSMPCSNEV